MSSPNQKTIVVAACAVLVLAIAVGGLIYIERSLRADESKPEAKPAVPSNHAAVASAVPAQGTPALPPGPPKVPDNLPKGLPAPPSLQNIPPEKRKEMMAKATEALKPAYATLYADFFMDAGLNGEQAEGILNLLIEDQQKTMERMLTIDPSTGRPNLPSPQEMQQQQEKIVQDIREKYGYEAGNKYEEYRKTVPDRSIVMSIQREVSTPLSRDQSSQVTRILYEERQAAMDRAASNPAQLAQEMQAMGTRVSERVQGIVSPEQAEAVTTALQRLTNPGARFQPPGGLPPAPPASNP